MVTTFEKKSTSYIGIPLHGNFIFVEYRTQICFYKLNLLHMTLGNKKF